MKKVLVSLVLLMCCMIASAQEYYVQSAGQGQGGRYLVSVVAVIWYLLQLMSRKSCPPVQRIWS